MSILVSVCWIRYSVWSFCSIAIESVSAMFFCRETKVSRWSIGVTILFTFFFVAIILLVIVYRVVVFLLCRVNCKCRHFFPKYRNEL